MAVNKTLSDMYGRAPNFPSPQNRILTMNSFPNDLVADGRNFYTEIQIVDYKSTFDRAIAGTVIPTGATTTLPTQIPGLNTQIPVTNTIDVNKVQNGGVLTPAGGMRLPIPSKVNEALTLTWSPISLTQLAGSVASTAAWALGPLAGQTATSLGNLAAAGAGAAGVFTGVAVNPNLYMMFQQPNFKEYAFRWTLAPRTQAESATIQNMITQLKQAASPKFINVGLMEYPQLLIIKFLPNDMFGNLTLKPCAIISVNVDYTPAGPAFFKQTGAPTLVNITLNLKEIFLWFREQIATTHAVSI